MTKLRIILQSNKIFYLFILITFFFSFIKINIFPYKSKIIPSQSFIGIVTNIKYDDNKYQLTIKNKEEIIGYYNSKENLNIRLGDNIEVIGNFYEPSNNTIPNSFSYKKYLNNHKIFYLMKISTIKIIEPNRNLFFKIKNYIIERCNKLKNTSGYVKAFIIGDKTNLELYSSFAQNGVSHLFALSGMHISMLTGIIYFILRKNKFKDILIILFLIFYITITNYSASLIRSTFFFILLKINHDLDLNISTKNVLILTACLLILYNPLIIYDYGFSYSVVVTYGLIISSKYFKKKYLINLLITSTISFLFSLPITLSMNYEINLLSIINNLLVVPLISIIIYPLSLIVFLFPFLEPLLSFFIFILEKINEVLNILSINIIIPKVHPLAFVLYYVVLILFNKSNNYKYILISILLILSIKLKPYINNNSYVYFLDVGQGDSALLVYQHQLILIDTGGLKNYSVSNNIIKLIKSLGYNHIELIVITHGDFDHVGEAINLVNNFEVEKVIFNCGPYNDLEKELIKVLNKKKIKYYSCIKELNIDNNKLFFLQTKEYDNENDNSNVIYTEINGYKFMFMGDASSVTEHEILSKYNLPDIDVLNVGHHGSKRSSGKEFINKINPKYSVISVGKNNRYGHPNKEVLNNLEQSKIYRTDQDGSIMFKIKNKKINIETCSP